ncbi:MAG: hypothetical protein V8R40_03875 [Dysosmobacter sp.]
MELLDQLHEVSGVTVPRAAGGPAGQGAALRSCLEKAAMDDVVRDFLR